MSWPEGHLTGGTRRSGVRSPGGHGAGAGVGAGGGGVGPGVGLGAGAEAGQYTQKAEDQEE